MSRPPKKMAISVHDRLTAFARARRENAQLPMSRNVIERPLPSQPVAPSRAVRAQGAMLFNLWADAPYRATGDLDLVRPRSILLLASHGMAPVSGRAERLP